MSKDFGLLFLRASIGLMMLIGHGIPKIMNYAQYSQGFPDPLGLGHDLSLILAIFTEVVCALFLIIGFFTRLSSLGLVITMLVAIIGVHINDPWNKIEFALLYALPFAGLFITGAGKFSVDSWMYRKFNFSLLEKMVRP